MREPVAPACAATPVETLWDKYLVYPPPARSAAGERVLFDPISLDSVFVSTEELEHLIAGGPGPAPALPAAPPYRSYRQALSERLAALGQTGRPTKVGGYRVVLTDKCNMACSYCFVDTNTGRPDMEEAELGRGLDFLFAQSAGEPSVYLQWFGGEPTIRFDLMQWGDERAEALAREHRVPRVYHTVVTNGVRLSEAMIGHYQRHHYGVGISLDGMALVNARERRLLGGQAVDEQIVVNARRLMEARVHVGCNLTPTRHNVPDLVANVEALFELGFTFIYVNTPIPARGGWEVSGAELARHLFAARMLALSRGAMVFSALDRVYQALDSRRPRVYEHLQGDGRINLALLPGGRLSLCDLNWKSPEFVYAIEQLRAEPSLLGRIAKPLALAERCDRCPAVAVCGGPSRNDLHLRQTAEPDPEMCAFYTTAMSLALWDDVGLQ